MEKEVRTVDDRWSDDGKSKLVEMLYAFINMRKYGVCANRAQMYITVEIISN